MSYPVQPTLANRLIVAGHSWTALPGVPYANTDFAQSTAVPRDQNQLPSILRDMLGNGGTSARFITAQVPDVAAGATATTSWVIGTLPEESFVEGVWFIPNGSLTGANTNTRELRLAYQNWLGTNVFAAVQLKSGVNLTAFQELTMNVFAGALLTDAAKAKSADTTPSYGRSSSLMIQPLWYAAGGAVQHPTPLIFQSAVIGTGHASIQPGGTVIVRLGSKYRNYGVNATRLWNSGVYFGGWASYMSHVPAAYLNRYEVNVTATAAVSATTIAVEALAKPIPSGAVVTFQNGATATLTAAAGFLASSLTVSALAAQVPIGQQGHSDYPASVGTGESLSPLGLHLFLWGVNDANQTGLIDEPAWRESVRAVCARACCPYFMPGGSANIVSTLGNGAGTPVWDNATAPPGGQFDLLHPNTGAGAFRRYRGGIGATAAKLDIVVGPAFQDSIIDLFFLAEAGTSRGGAATITVDGATPPQGVVTVNTSGASTVQNTGTLAGTFSTTSGSTAATSTVTQNQLVVGQIVDNATNLAKGTYVAAINGTAVTLSQNAIATNSGQTWTNRGFVPMVKRLTGLATGAHTVTITLTGMDASDGSAAFWFLGYGIESSDPTTPVLWCNIAKTPSQTTQQKIDTATLNTDSLSVINGTATMLAGNTAEPALTPNVVYADIDSIINQTTKFFLNDGLHPNSRGAGMLARYLYGLLKNRFSTQQLAAR